MSRPAPSVIGWDDEYVYCQVFRQLLKNDHSFTRHTVGSAVVCGPDRDAGAMAETLALSTLPPRLQTHSSSVVFHGWRACSHLRSNGHRTSYPIPPCVKENHHRPMVAAFRATGRLQWILRPPSAPPAQRRPPQRRQLHRRQLMVLSIFHYVPRRQLTALSLPLRPPSDVGAHGGHDP